MNKNQIDYILKNYQTHSVKEIAETLRLDPKEIRRELKKILSSGARPPEETFHEKRVFRLPPFWLNGALLLLLLTFTLLIYYRGLSHPFLNWDDPKYVTENRLIRTLSKASLKEMFGGPYFSLYIPMTLVSYAVDYQLSHFNPRGYHFTNLLLHLMNTALVYGLVVWLTRERVLGVAVALVFGIHPVQIESVVWIAERKNLLSGFFFLSSFLAYIHSRAISKDPVRMTIVSLLFFLLACLSKPSVVVMPLLLLTFDASYGYLKGKKDLLRYLPFLLIALFFTFVTMTITQREGKMAYHGGSLSSTLLLMTVAMMKYLELLFFPLRQSLIYEFPLYKSFLDPPVALSLMGLLIMGGGLLYLWRHEKRLFFWGAWYLILLLPVMNFIPFPSLMNDRYLYLPLIGFMSLLFLLTKRLAGLLPTALLLFAAAFGFTFLNLERQVVWSQPEKLWLETQTKTVEQTAPYINLGTHYLEQEKPDKAIQQFEKALKIDKGDAAAHNGLGIAYFKKGDIETSIDYFKMAVLREPRGADYRANLAKVYEAQGKFESALGELKEAVSLVPNQASYRNNLGTVLERIGRLEEAEEEFSETLELDPGFAEALYNLGLLQFRKGHLQEAEKNWSQFLKLHPNHSKAREVRDKLAVMREESDKVLNAEEP